MAKANSSPGREDASGSIDLKSLIGKLEAGHELLREAGDLESTRLRQILLVNEELARDMIAAEMEIERAGVRQKEMLREVADMEQKSKRVRGELEELTAARDRLGGDLQRIEGETGPLQAENERLQTRVAEAAQLLERLRSFRDEHRKALADHMRDIDANTERDLADGNA